MKKSKLYAVRFAGLVILFFILSWLSAYLLIDSNAKVIHELAITQINKQIKGSIQIGSISSDFFRNFPNISVCLSDVFIRDSLWSQHHHDFLQAKDIYVSFRFLSLVRGKPEISKVIVKNGFIHLYTDECGNCNLNRKEDISFSQDHAAIPDFTFRQSRLIIENEFLHSYHDMDAKYLTCRVVKKDTMFVLHINMHSLVHSISFNLFKGGYLTNKDVEGQFCLEYYPGDKTTFRNLRLKINHHPFTLNGFVDFKADTMAYTLLIHTLKIPYPSAVSLLTESLQKQFVSFKILAPFDIDGTVEGKMAFRVIPRVTTQFSITDANMETPIGVIEHCSYTGNFSNQINPLAGPGDENSRFVINQFKGTWSKIPITSTRMEISNLKNPLVRCDLQSIFELDRLNELTESSTIRFFKGTCDLDITYYGSLTKQDSIHSQVNGNICLAGAELQYLPRNLVFYDCSGEVEFQNEDLIIRQLWATVGNNNLSMSGRVDHLLAMLNLNPEQLTMEWNITTRHLNLNDFVSYVGQKSEVNVKKSSRKNKMIQVSENIDRMLSDGTAKLSVFADSMSYKKFVATHIEASLMLIENKIQIKDVRLNHAGGLLSLKGSLTNGSHTNIVNLQSTIEHVDIPGLFYAFDNFGQDAITQKNMKGQLTATVDVTGVLSDKALIIPNSLKGNVEFTVKDGELNQFEPVMKIATTAFKKRDFSQLKFSELHNTLTLNGSAITFDRMEIRTNQVILFVEGTYDTKLGTDMSIQVPVSNLTNVENENMENTGRAGMNIRLRAKTGEDGKLKISWDPFKNAIRNKKDEKTDTLKVVKMQ